MKTAVLPYYFLHSGRLIQIPLKLLPLDQRPISVHNIEIFVRVLVDQHPQFPFTDVIVSKDLTSILRDIRDTHRKDATTADESCAALEVQKQLQDAMDYKGSPEEKKARLFLANLGIDYDALTMEQFANLIEVLKLSKHMSSPISQRGKGSMTHGKGKRKRK